MFTAMRRAFVAGEHLCCRSPARLVFEVDVGVRVAVGVAYDVALPFELRVWLLDRPGRREAARHLGRSSAANATLPRRTAGSAERRNGGNAMICRSIYSACLISLSVVAVVGSSGS